MKISLQTMRQMTDLDLNVDELVMKINEQLGQVEEIVDFGAKYKGIVIVKVMNAEKHPNADKLTVCMVDDGGVVNDVPRDENGYVQVVCGAPNAREGIFAVWLPPKVVVPATFNDTEPFVLGARELRGETSQGMLASADELAVGSGHNGIIELVAEDMNGAELKPGLDFAETFGLNDTIIDIENKMFTHRPDCFGQLGVAREIFAVTQPEPASDKATDIRFKEEEWYWPVPQFENASGLELKVTHDAGLAVPRFMAVAVKDVEVKPSPFWLQATLVRWGAKPINNIVDLTNYLMLLTAQPTHAYDYDKLRGHSLGVRMAQKGENISLLNGKTYSLGEEDIVIVDGEGPVGLAGVMGGKDCEVSAETKNVVFECATFDMYSIRKTSMRHGLFTDAVTRFNKGQSPLQNGRIARHLLELVPGTQASNVFDLPSRKGLLEEVSVHGELQVTPSFINQRLGLGLTGYAIGNLLRRANFATYPIEDANPDSLLSITAPFWRTDIELPEDIVEEVGRLYGFDKLPRELPKRGIVPVSKNPSFELKQRIRQALARAGANEVLTYSFVHENTFEKAEQDKNQAFQLSNALSPDLQYYRLSVLPSLLDKVHMNIKAGHDEFVLFEIGKGHNKKQSDSDDGNLPKEIGLVDAVYTSKKPKKGAPYFRMRRLVSQLAQDLGFTVKLEPADKNTDYPVSVSSPFELSRSALVTSRHGEFLGIVGELKQSVVKNFRLPDYTSATTLDFEGLAKASCSAGFNYSPLPKYPKVSQDISLKVANKVTYEDVFQLVWWSIEETQPGKCDVKLSPLSIYRADNDLTHKTISLHVEVASHERTLTDQDVSQILDAVTEATKKKLNAERV